MRPGKKRVEKFKCRERKGAGSAIKLRLKNYIKIAKRYRNITRSTISWKINAELQIVLIIVPWNRHARTNGLIFAFDHNIFWIERDSHGSFKGFLSDDRKLHRAQSDIAFAIVRGLLRNWRTCTDGLIFAFGDVDNVSSKPTSVVIEMVGPRPRKLVILLRRLVTSTETRLRPRLEEKPLVQRGLKLEERKEIFENRWCIHCKMSLLISSLYIKGK